MYVYSLCATRGKKKEEETAQPETWSSRRDFFFIVMRRVLQHSQTLLTRPQHNLSFYFIFLKNKNKGYYFFSFCVDKIFYLLLPFIVRVEI
jgi:hypothetical protein